MTSRFRLLAALAALVLSLMAGWSSGGLTKGPTPGATVRAAAPVPPLTENDVDRFVEAIDQSDLFPSARLRSEIDRNLPDEPTSSQLAEALSDPSLSALVQRGDTWRIYLFGAVDGSVVRQAGDQLADGWVIETIEATRVTLRREGESRRIDVFESELSADET